MGDRCSGSLQAAIWYGAACFYLHCTCRNVAMYQSRTKAADMSGREKSNKLKCHVILRSAELNHRAALSLIPNQFVKVARSRRMNNVAWDRSEKRKPDAMKLFGRFGISLHANVTHVASAHRKLDAKTDEFESTNKLQAPTSWSHEYRTFGDANRHRSDHLIARWSNLSMTIAEQKIPFRRTGDKTNGKHETLDKC